MDCLWEPENDTPESRRTSPIHGRKSLQIYLQKRLFFCRIPKQKNAYKQTRYVLPLLHFLPSERNLRTATRNLQKFRRYGNCDDGNTKILKDRYDEKLTEVSIPFVISTLEKILEGGETYRRIYPLLNALKTFDEQKDKWGELAVLHYGY